MAVVDVGALWALYSNTFPDNAQLAIRHLQVKHGLSCGVAAMRYVLESQAKCAELRRQWDAYAPETFLPAAYGVLQICAVAAEPRSALLYWIAYCSWTYCTRCLRLRTCRELGSCTAPLLQSSVVLCGSRRCKDGRCSLPHTDILYAEPGEQLRGELATEQVYVCPRKHDWPVYDEQLAAYVPCDSPQDVRPSMLELSAEDAQALSLISIFCDYKK